MTDKSQLNILHVLRAPAGGLFRHVLDLAQGQAERGHRVGIVAAQTAPDTPADAKLGAIAANLALGVSRIPMRRQIGLGDAAAVRHVARTIAATEPDIVHGHGAKGGAYARLARSSGIHVYTPHGGSLHYGRWTPQGLVYGAAERFLILLSFSRAASGQLGFTGAMVLALTFLTTPSANLRMRVVLIAMAGVAAIALLLAALLSVDVVANLFKERMSLNQNYDVGQTGRFGRHLLGAILALDVPFGIGPLQFSKIFPEDPHNSYLNAFMSGGWLSGVCYPTLVLLTLAYGLRCVFIATPWQSTMIVIYSAYAGMMVESIVIDSDHWRHMFLLLGVLWGLIAATRVSVARASSPGRLRPSLVPTSPAA
jgi:hypothetical protein